jgi:hypothetical protein
MPIHSILIAAGALSLSLLMPVSALADEPVPDAEEQVDEGLKEFGYLTGLARSCVAADQQTALEREAVDLHAAVGRLLGTDRAFLFAAAFGYGTSVAVESEDCRDVLDRYEARVEGFRAGRETAQ